MDYSEVLNNSKETVQALITFMSVALAMLLGTFFIFSGLKKVADYSNGQRQGQPIIGPVCINFFIGASLLQFSFMIKTIVYTMFGASLESPSRVMDYMPPQVKEGGGMVTALVGAAVWWIAAIGVAAILRGFIIWNDLAKGDRAQSSAGWKGFWHIFFGAACVNLTGVFKLFGSGS